VQVCEGGGEGVQMHKGKGEWVQVCNGGGKEGADV
jgi:hypothetical protein